MRTRTPGSHRGYTALLFIVTLVPLVYAGLIWKVRYAALIGFDCCWLRCGVTLDVLGTKDLRLQRLTARCVTTLLYLAQAGRFPVYVGDLHLRFV